MSKCEYCDQDITECLQDFEVTAYTEHDQPINDKSFSNINEGIDWAKSFDDCEYILVFQGCDRENQILSLDIKEG